MTDMIPKVDYSIKRMEQSIEATGTMDGISFEGNNFKITEILSHREMLKSCLAKVKEANEREDLLEKEIEHLKNKLKLIVDNLTTPKERKDDNGKVQALEMVRCGIGSNFGGSYYDEVMSLVYEPLLLSIKE